MCAFDGRIDNRDSLIAALLGPVSCGSENTDAELCARAFERWGDSCAVELIGEFAFAIWDRRAKRLFCARDPFGVRPLYYRESGGTLVVATDWRAILAHPRMTNEPNERHVAETMLGQLSNMTDTLYEGIVRVPPAHLLTVRGERVETVEYWDVDLDRDLDYSDARDYVDHLLAVTSTAVLARMRTTKEVMVALSGGLDSSLVLALSAEAFRSMADSPPSLTAVSLCYPGLECDETPWIEAVASHTDTEVRMIEWTPLSWEEELEEAVRVQGLPPYPNLMIDRFTRSGISNGVVMSGSGGDQWMNGHTSHFADLWFAHQYGALLGCLRYGGRSVVLREFRAAAQGRASNRIRRLRGGADVAAPCSPDPAWMGPVLRGRAAADIPRTVSAPEVGSRSKLRRYGSLHDTWEPYVFEIGDQAVARTDLVGTEPFYDRRLVEFAFSVPDSQRWRGRDRRWLERRMLAGLVPPEVAQRTSKTEFSPVVMQQLRTLDLEENLRSFRAVAAGWLDPSVADQFASTALSFTAAGPGLELWPLVAVELWLRAVWG